MQTTKILQWLLTFGVLTAFTVHTVGQVQEQSRLIAFAQTMEETESVRARLYIVASPVDPSSSIFDRTTPTASAFGSRIFNAAIPTPQKVFPL